MYGVTHKGKNYKDDPIIFNFVELKLYFVLQTLIGVLNDLAKKVKSIKLQETARIKKKDGIKFVQSSLKSHLLWVTL